MKPIKFRAWIKTKNGEDMYPVGVFNNKVFISTIIPYYGNAYIPITAEYGEVIDVMQNTGIKDKKEKEIYEGDIIKAKNIFDETIIGVVAYNPYSMGWGLKYYDLDDSFPEEIRKKGYIYLGIRSCEDIEIIGNIYENPELIKGE